MSRPYLLLLALVFLVSCKKTLNEDDGPGYLITDRTSRTKGLDRISEANFQAIPAINKSNLFDLPGVGRTAHIPEDWMLQGLPHPIDQRDMKAGASFAAAYLARTYINYKTKGLADYVSAPNTPDTTILFNPLFVHNQLPVDKRRNLYEVFNFLQTEGVSNMEDMPFFYVRDTVTIPSTIAKSNALNHRTGPAYRLAQYDVDLFKKVLVLYDMPIIVGLTIDNALERMNKAVFRAISKQDTGHTFHYTWNKYLTAGDPSDDPAYEMQKSLHAMVIVGYDDVRNAFLLQNSWGLWGEYGRVWVDYDFLKQALLYNAGSASPNDPYAFVLTEYNAPTLKTGLVLDLPFNSNTNDVSGSNNHGIRSANVTFGADRAGDPGSKSLMFNGHTQAGTLTIPSSPSLDFMNECTISLWIKPGQKSGLYWDGTPTTTDPKFNIFNKGTVTTAAAPGNFHGLSMFYEFQEYLPSLNWTRTNIVWASPENSGTADVLKTYEVQFDNNGWQHVALVVKYYDFRGLYIGGELKHHFQFAYYNGFGNSNGKDLVFSKDFPFFGQIDDVRVYNRALSAREIRILAHTE